MEKRKWMKKLNTNDGEWRLKEMKKIKVKEMG